MMLADRISSNIRDLENTFDKIILHGKILNNHIDVNAAKIILKEIFPSTAFKTVSIKTIIETMCDFYGIKKEDILAQSRLKELVYPRQIGMYLALELTNETTKKIGFEFGGRTHSTVIHAYKAIKELIEGDSSKESAKAKQDVSLLKIQIYGS
jgi:chromosomal replication initiator protein